MFITKSIKYMSYPVSSPPTSNNKKRKELSNDSSKKSIKKEKHESNSNSVVLEEDAIQCTICYSAPADMSLFQCSNGHLHCNTCTELIDRCSLCGEDFDIRKPSRNRVAEMVVAKIMDNCPNPPCKMKLERAKLKKHVEQTCSYAKIECKYKSMGCNWSGLRRENKHIGLCSLKVTQIDKVDKRIGELKALFEPIERKMKFISENNRIEMYSFSLTPMKNSLTKFETDFKSSVFLSNFGCSLGFSFSSTTIEFEFNFSPKNAFKRINLLILPQMVHSKIAPCCIMDLCNEHWFEREVQLLISKPFTTIEIEELKTMKFDMIFGESRNCEEIICGTRSWCDGVKVEIPWMKSEPDG